MISSFMTSNILFYKHFNFIILYSKESLYTVNTLKEILNVINQKFPVQSGCSVAQQKLYQCESEM